MTFSEIQFPSDISYGATGGPTYSTDIVTMFSGHEQRNSNWHNARAKYNIASGIKTEEQWQRLIAFFRARKGKAIGFRFKDWSDYKASDEQIGIGDGLSMDFQLVKTYTSQETVSRDITKPVNGTVRIFFNDNIITGSDYSIDYTTGIVKFNEPPEESIIITADFEFDVPVRFDMDELQLSLDGVNSANWHNISLIELRI